MFKITFLSGDVPLTKTIRKDGSKSSYPNVKNFTSIDVDITGIADMHKHIMSMAVSKSKPCLLKGQLKQALKNEPRKGMMPANTPTQWVCFDLDKAPFSTPEEFMRAIGLPDLSYVVQYSSSYKLTKDKTLNCHIFVLLNRAISPQNLKAWLMYLNLHVPVLEKSISLSNSLNALHWPLDITTCQNDKLLYIATPTFIGTTDPVKPAERIQLVKKQHDLLDVSKIILKPIDALKKEQIKKRDQLREAIGLKKLTSKAKVIDDYTVQPGCSEATSYEIVERNDEFTRLNLNGGDSAAYWYYNTDFELIRNFKGEDFMYMKEVLPDLYKQLKGESKEDLYSISEDGDVVLAFRDKASGQYWKGLWNESTTTLDLHPIDAKDKLHDFLMSHGVAIPPYIPEWQVVFDPQSKQVVDPDRRIVNRFVPTKLMRESTPGKFPTIQKFIDHAIGTGPIQEHFLNWLAVIVQHRRKTKTAWILHGTEGTGKGVLVDVVLRAIFEGYISTIRADELNSEFNQWLEKALFVFVDEIEIDAFEKKSSEGKLRALVTNSPLPIRRMRTDTYDAPNFSNFIFASNKPQPVRIPMHDRRYNVAKYQPTRLITTAHEVEVVIPSEISAFAHYLNTRTACIDTAAQVLKTEDRAAIQELSITSADELGHMIVEGNLMGLIEYIPDERLLNEHGLSTPTAQAYLTLMKDIAINGTDKLTRDQLRIIFEHCIGKVPEGAHKFTSYLRHHGIRTKRIKAGGLIDSGVHVDWKVSPQDKKDLLKAFQPKQLVRRVK